jgi:hypothetical protein
VPYPAADVQLRLYLYDRDGLWLEQTEGRQRPPVLELGLEEYEVYTSHPSLVRIADLGDRTWKKFKVEKLPYDLGLELKATLRSLLGAKVEVEILNLKSSNFDSAYKAIILFVSIKNADVAAAEKHGFRWLTIDDLLAADEFEGKINGIDTFHIRELRRMKKNEGSNT